MELTAAPPKPFSSAAPVAQKERIIILDSLRGIAILGILLMNIAGMGLPVYSDPTVLDEKDINHTSWYFMTWFADGTQRALFSILFGAGIILCNQPGKKGKRPAACRCFFPPPVVAAHFWADQHLHFVMVR